MYSFIVLIFTSLQLLVVGVSYFAGASVVFYNAAVYGSPFYSAMTLLRSDSAIFDNNPLYLIMFAYHIVKYILFYMAQNNEGRNGALITAVVFEAIYLCINAYYIN